MGKKDPRVDAYIARSAAFAKPILSHLRKVIHAGCPTVEETMKWSFPHFMYKGMLASMAAFKAHCAFGFWKGSIIFNERKGGGGKADEAMGYLGRITRLTDLPARNVLLGYVKKAVKLNDSGVKLPPRRVATEKEKKALVVPPYLLAALRKNKKARSTFDAFSYSHKKEYVEWLTEAKTPDTRAKRLATTIEWLSEGKSRHWKYANC